MRRLTVAGALLFSIAVLFQALASSVRVERKFFFDYIPSARESAQIYFGGPQLLVKWTPVMGTSLFTELGGDETAVGEIPPPEATGVICVSLYEDANGTGVWEPGEALLPEGRFSLVNLDTDKTLASYVTDGSNEPYCFFPFDSASLCNELN